MESLSESAEFFDAADREAAETVLRQAFIAAQLGMPSEDPETAVDSLWILFEALLVDHLAPDPRVDPDRESRRVALENHWQRLVTTAVTHTFVLTGDFVMPEERLDAVVERAHRLASGRLWHTRRPPAQGAVVLAVHEDLRRLEETASEGRFPTKDDAEATVDLIAFATLGAVMARGYDSGSVTTRAVAGSTASAGSKSPSVGRDPSGVEPDDDAGGRGRWARTPTTVAEAFGIPEVELRETQRSGWVCVDCGCVFSGRVDAGVAYPDRLAPVGRNGPCDAAVDCPCHAAPLQRRIR